MYNLLKIITLADAVDRDDIIASLRATTQSLPGLRSFMCEGTLPGVYNGGDILWRAVFDDSSAATAAMASASGIQIQALTTDEATVAHVDLAAFEGGQSGESSDGSGLYRVALFCANVRPDAERLAAFGRDTATMPKHVRTMKRWQLSVTEEGKGSRPWTHVWEQEYADLDGLNGAYMMHPVHWAHVERWFDPEYVERLVDSQLVHTFCAISEAVIV